MDVLGRLDLLLRGLTHTGHRNVKSQVHTGKGVVAVQGHRLIVHPCHYHDQVAALSTDPISIDRTEFDAAYDRLAAAGLPLKPDRDQCWRDFAGWRVNYDTVLLDLARLTMAPYAPWSSDRSMRGEERALNHAR